MRKAHSVKWNMWPSMQNILNVLNNLLYALYEALIIDWTSLAKI